MMNYDLPCCIEINGEEHPIRKRGHYKVILDVIAALNDDELTEQQRIQAALIIFYEDVKEITDYQTAAEKMMDFINEGETDSGNSTDVPLMDWEQDFKLMVSPINKIMGAEIRSLEYLHWWSFLGAYKEIGECTFSTVISIRKKKQKGQKLDKWEQEFYRENRKIIDIPKKLSPEERTLLEADW